MKQIDTCRLTPEQIEALLQFEHGHRDLRTPDTESQVALEAYVAERDLKPANEAA